MKILIADDHEIVRKGLSQILQDGFPEVIITEAADTQELIRNSISKSFDFIISDLSMPGGGGLTAIQKIRDYNSTIPIMIITNYPEEQYMIKVMQLGASGFLNKEAASEELIKAIKKLMTGKRYVQESLANEITDKSMKMAGLLPHELLGEEEHDVMIRLSQGFPVAEVARQLNLNQQLISDYRISIFKKLRIKSNAELMRYVIQNNLI